MPTEWQKGDGCIWRESLITGKGKRVVHWYKVVKAC